MAKSKNLKPFLKGNDKRRNTTGANVGSKWKKTLLKELMTVELTGNELDSFQKIQQRFPSVFDGSEEKNFQLFMELKQVSLVFSKDERVAQTAIERIKDRIEGKALQKAEVTVTDKPLAAEELRAEILRLQKMREDVDH